MNDFFILQYVACLRDSNTNNKFQHVTNCEEIKGNRDVTPPCLAYLAAVVYVSVAQFPQDGVLLEVKFSRFVRFDTSHQRSEATTRRRSALSQTGVDFFTPSDSATGRRFF